ncbi:MAG TPA: hypothetical protein VG013_22185 [Gemmataceae bacterium]|nr:hypothetical protein [Gemmataceae bacterium]
MKRWVFICAGLGLAALALAATGRAEGVSPRRSSKPVPEAERGEGLSLTIYNQDFVVVKDRRTMDLKQGRATMRFRGVAATIVPESVQFFALKEPDVAHVAEQNYEFDLVSADKLLDKYIDKQIGVVLRDGDVLKGRLLSFDGQQLVLKTANGIGMVPRGRNVKDVQFSALPGGLLTRPTLVWELDSRKSGKELVKVAYRADRMSWRVDYRAKVNGAGDRLDLSGWVTVTNNTGTSYQDALVKLMAGDVHVVQPPMSTPQSKEKAGEQWRQGRSSGFAEKSFAEYHLYELGRKTSVKDRETKQIELLNVDDIPVVRKYEYRNQGSKVAVVLEFKNSQKVTQGLGIPLPKGPIRVFQRDTDGELEFAGTDNIDHTPKNEEVHVRLGDAFDLAGEYRVLNASSGPNFSQQDVEIRLRNHKKDDVKIDVIEPINGHANWVMLKQSTTSVQRDVNTLVFPVEVKANGETVVTYTIRYNW